MEIELIDADSAAGIQATIDALPPSGGTVVLPAMDLELDRGIQVRSGVTLRGQGAATILRKGPGRASPLTGYHNYGMRDVPLASTDGLVVGMTVSIQAERSRGFYDTFARVTWIDNGWVGLSVGLSADYAADAGPRLTTTSPLIFGHDVCNATDDGAGQIAIEAAAHDIVVHNCTIGGAADHLPGIHIARSVRDIVVVENTYTNCVPVVGAGPLSRLPEIACGYGSAADADFQHLG